MWSCLGCACLYDIKAKHFGELTRCAVPGAVIICADTQQVTSWQKHMSLCICLHDAAGFMLNQLDTILQISLHHDNGVGSIH